MYEIRAIWDKITNITAYTHARTHAHTHTQDSNSHCINCTTQFILLMLCFVLRFIYVFLSTTTWTTITKKRARETDWAYPAFQSGRHEFQMNFIWMTYFQIFVPVANPLNATLPFPSSSSFVSKSVDKTFTDNTNCYIF